MATFVPDTPPRDLAKLCTRNHTLQLENHTLRGEIALLKTQVAHICTTQDAVNKQYKDAIAGIAGDMQVLLAFFDLDNSESTPAPIAVPVPIRSIPGVHSGGVWSVPRVESKKRKATSPEQEKGSPSCKLRPSPMSSPSIDDFLKELMDPIEEVD
jgi:hypothetical protein